MTSKDSHLTDIQILRKKATELLITRKSENKIPVIEADTNKLLHELQVHQIELEMQNEELRAVNEIAETALKKYTLLYDFAPMGYLTIDPDGIILELNFTAAEMLKEKRFSIVNTNLRVFIPEESKSKFDKFIKDVFASYSKESCKLKLGFKDEALCYVYMEGIVLNGDKKCLLSLVDITNFQKT